MEGLPEHLRGLLQADAYPHAVASIHLVETHVSWIVLTGEWAYKIKRPVRFAFIDLSALQHRAFYCAEEVRLNRRFAPQLYVQVCEITESPDGARLGGDGRVIEYAVKMIQFPMEQGLDRLLADEKIDANELEGFGASLADIHRELPVAHLGELWSTATAVRATVLENLEECAEASSIFHVYRWDKSLREKLEQLLDKNQACLSVRREQGFVRECHGDLHVRNVVRYESQLVAFDCMEFEPKFRWIDVAEDIAFLWMDLRRHGRTAHANAFLNGYLARSGDHEACRLIPLYAVHRAIVRAKVAALAVRSSPETREIESARASFSRYIEIAQMALRRKCPRLMLMHGLSGSGKSWLAHQLAPRLEAIHLRSDVERKRLVESSERYSPDVSQKVYERLVNEASAALAGGFNVIVDATFLRASDRKLFAQHSPPATLIRCHAPVDVMQARILKREAEGTDPSEADLSVLVRQQSQNETLDEQEGFSVIDVDTTKPKATEHLMRKLD